MAIQSFKNVLPDDDERHRSQQYPLLNGDLEDEEFGGACQASSNDQRRRRTLLAKALAVFYLIQQYLKPRRSLLDSSSQQQTSLLAFSTGDSKTGSILRAAWVAVRPTILCPTTTTNRKVHATAWLDGLRGIACFTVVFYHNSLLLYPGHCAAWQSSDSRLFRLPVLRLPCTGPAMVDIFFVISGYALSCRPLSLTRTADFTRFSESLSSALFRRGIRLYAPVVFLTLLNAVLSYLKLFDPEGADHVPYDGTVAATLWHWLDDLLTGLNPLNLDRYHSWNIKGLRYAIGMWTIPFEYRGSIIVFVVLLALGRTRPPLRFAVIASLVLYCVAQGQWDVFLFLSGPLCCDLHHYLENRTMPQSTSTSASTSANSSGVVGLSSEKPQNPRQRTNLIALTLKRVALISGLVAILAVVTMPEYPHMGDVRLYTTIKSFDPSSWDKLPSVGRFPVCVASVVLVFYTGQTRMLRRFLSTPFPQYLGENSFGIYLMHVTLINSIGRPLMRFLSRIPSHVGLRPEGQVGSWLVFLLYAAIAIPTLFWISELVTRYVDKKSVQLARWLEQKCMMKTA
ncbi:hypothetical protein H2204_007503 [Knufia peltigerae]|uniref:Acyltransferase 3 domain-containing protein n=1 Tax=Knufia peltigerae TaxID=1002370 RepID=A0AA38Y1P0_9EURO|nr:hypothetical protein H2204_007503 [Knufia peltigerae]